jgi:hypothetical protein
VRRSSTSNCDQVVIAARGKFDQNTLWQLRTLRTAWIIHIAGGLLRTLGGFPAVRFRSF